MNRRDALPTYIGNKIKQRREEIGFKQSELSERLGVSRASVSNIESGRHVVQITTLYELADILEVNVGYFLPNVYQEKENSLEFYTDARINLQENVEKRLYLDNLISAL